MAAAKKAKTAKVDTIKEPIAHVLVPKHELLSDKEASEILAHYNITVNELPKILPGDPAIRHLGVKYGDIIKVTRKSISAGESVFYRGVASE
jgi:DNA-directed RNA polymerase subunit H